MFLRASLEFLSQLCLIPAIERFTRQCPANTPVRSSPDARAFTRIEANLAGCDTQISTSPAIGAFRRIRLSAHPVILIERVIAFVALILVHLFVSHIY